MKCKKEDGYGRNKKQDETMAERKEAAQNDFCFSDTIVYRDRHHRDLRVSQ